LADTESAGPARISLGAAGQQVEVARFEFTLAPQESRVFPLNSGGATGDSNTLAIYKQTGALILLKSATIKRGAIAAPIIMTPPATTIPTPTKTFAIGAKELIVKARLVAGRPGKPWRVEIMAPVAQRLKMKTAGRLIR
jgi:hypothetical protein